VRPGSRRTAVLHRAAQPLPEGRWDCYVVPRGGTRGRRRLRAELVEQAALLTLPVVVDARGVSAWIPYTTSDGFLAVRSWLRPAHAEVERVHVGDAAVTVTALLLGRAEPGAWEAARVVAVPRDGRAGGLELPVRPLGGGRFRCAVPAGDVLARSVGGQDVWDLVLACEPGADPVPLGRIAGDGVSRRKTDVFPEGRLRPCFTTRHTLTLTAEPQTAGQPAHVVLPGPGRASAATV
jgi:hypothetical protein